TEAQVAEWFRLDWGRWIDMAIIVALVLAVYVLLWVQVGRDPRGGPVMVRYEPPDRFSPAGLGYVVERGPSDRQLSAAVVDLAVRGWVEIEREGRHWVLRRTDQVPSEQPPPEEVQLLRDLFGGQATGVPGREVTLKGSSDPKVRKAAKAFRSRVGRGLEGEYFHLNRKWFLVGLALTALGFGLLAWRDRFAIAPEGWFLGLWLTFWTMGTATLAYRVVQGWRAAPASGITGWMGAGFTTLFAVPFFVAEVVVLFMLWQSAPAYLLVGAVLLGAINVLFYHLLERPTLKGHGVLQQAEGFRRFLTSTEEDRIRVLQPAGAPLKLFERFLPWAIALGVESEWARHFEDALTAQAADPAGVQAGVARTPSSGLGWYSGAAATSLTGLSGSLGSALSSSLSASSSAPSSSGGGGGGGGSSGGGGGGGGGGGW
ncbi:MAG: DUF2207 domain-containing protein, partial [Gemmatimonadota bacterium]